MGEKIYILKPLLAIGEAKVENGEYQFLHCTLIYLIWVNSFRVSLVAQMIKRLPAIWETQVQSLGREDAMEEEMATYSSILAWKIPWAEESGGL